MADVPAAELAQDVVASPAVLAGFRGAAVDVWSDKGNVLGAEADKEVRTIFTVDSSVAGVAYAESASWAVVTSPVKAELDVLLGTVVDDLQGFPLSQLYGIGLG